MAKEVKLMYVDGLNGANNNKYYNMKELGDGYFQIEYGRVGATKTVDKKPMSKWNTVYREKTKKGYKDVTSLYIVEEVEKVDFADITDPAISGIIAKLQAYSKGTVAANYNVSAEAVTQKQIDEAQSILNDLVNLSAMQEINKTLLELYKVIPRRMSNVKDYLLVAYNKDQYDKMLSREQDILDTMASQVKQVSLVNDNKDSSVTLLDALGIEIFKTDSKEVDLIKVKLDNLANKYASSFRITNKKTQVKFDKYLEKATNKKTELFWHGSRNENWMSILETGLVLRPTNAVISGKMFGYGTYFADKAQKSYGYTSGLGSYWARGNASEAYMALYDVHVGNQYVVESSDSSLDKVKLRQKGNYDSTFAKAGRSLINNEYIVYDEDQSTVKFLVQLKG